MAHIFKPGGSAPGYDGISYEPLHVAAKFTTHPAVQALRAAHRDSGDLDDLLGLSVDLLI